ncbi:heavy-metal-associated domain-containing protein [Bacillus sp. DNRA2]|uniref:heavy-metal-associated domain-containing protein n=1 Tax=Bacillus sp. DNRA2 TaxID=2723053 RepID=UPI00145F0CC7|nr:heavy-metal-associated domain-containing protein [Bacillus sp. DNRA2]NMD70835.1 heavy-metal-associated domain-containing protein [Bacillus sp. DNRA2]
MSLASFQLEELTCPSCIKKIESSLQKIDGVASVKVMFNSSKVKTEFDATLVNATVLEETIKKLGYEVLLTKVS